MNIEMVNLTDREIALAVRNGKREAYGELVRRYQSSVFNVCYRILGDRFRAEDIAQEAFIRAFHRFHLYDISRPFGPWVRKIASNLCLNALQKNNSEYHELLDEHYVPPDSSAENPERKVEENERSREIRSAILSLPPHYRVVIELRHFQDMSYAEIAETLDIPMSDVKSHLFRARRLLARRLKVYV